LIDHLFHTQPTYSDGLISRRLKEDYNLQATARHIKTIRLRNGWLRRQALQVLDSHNMTLRTRGMRRKRRENYVVPEPDWLWCLDGHDKLARYGIEIYGSVNAYSRKII
jgi:hypothetical protein